MARAHQRDTDPDFGPLVYEKDLSLTPAGLLVRGLIAGLITLAGVVAFFGGLAEEGKLPLALIGGAMALVATPAWYFLAYRVRVNRFLFFRRGLEQTTREGTRRMAYSDVAVFTYNVSRVTVNRIYSHTDVLIEFRPEAGDSVVYHSQDRDENDDLAEVREVASEAVAARFAREAGTAVEWCEGLRFLPEGLEVTPPAVFGKPKSTIVPYDQLTRVTFDAGYCRAFATGKDEPLFEKQVLLPNFFPGFLHLERLTGGRLKTR